MTEATIYWLLIANCAFNVLLSCTAIILNIVTIHALRKTLSLQQPLKIMLLSLALSDLGVGLLVQPLFIAYLVMTIEQNIENNQTYNFLENALAFTGRFLVLASFLGITALSADRFLAIHLHLRYHELVTHKRVVALVILVWLSSVFFSILDLFLPFNVSFVIFTTVQAACFIFTTYFYCKIYLAVRRHTNQIQALQVADNSDVLSNASRQKKSAVAIFYVYLVFWACYLPDISLTVAINVTTGPQITLLEHLSLYAITLVHLNSSLNPLIYNWKMRYIRHAVMNILQRILPSYN